jgi:hypothetical protein
MGMSLEDMQKAIERNKLAEFIGNELLLMSESGRLGTDYLKFVKHDEINLAYRLIEKLEKEGYKITNKD